MIGPPAVSVTTGDIFATIEAKVGSFPLFFFALINIMNDHHLIIIKIMENSIFHMKRWLSSRLTWRVTSVKLSLKRSHLSHLYLIYKGPSIYYVIQIWGPERPPPHCRVTKSKNFPDSKIFVTKTFRIKRVNRANFQSRDKCT